MSDMIEPKLPDDASTPSRRAEDGLSRRNAFKIAGGALAAGALISTTSSAQTITPPNDLTEVDYINFVMNLHYLQASLYSGAIRGEFLSASVRGLPASTPTEPNLSPVNLTDPVLRDFVTEMMFAELAHIAGFRNNLDQGFLGEPPAVIRTIPAPAMTLNVNAVMDDGYSRVFGGMIRELYGRAFSLYGIEEDYLIAISYLKDIAATAYQAVADLQTDSLYRDMFVSILGTQTAQAAILRDMIYERAQQPGSRLIEISNRLAQTRSSADPATAFTDQGVERVSTAAGFASNIVPTDQKGRSQSRTPLQVMLLLVGRPIPFVSGLFFPQGFNGRINLAMYGIT